MKLSAWIFFLLCWNLAFPQIQPPAPIGPLPSENQLRWQEMEQYAFIHFSINTYTNEAWGFGNEDLSLFNPTELDCRQWARICKESGMKGIILTAKHHSGFCLWPSKYTEYSVKNTPWKNGKGDVVKEMAEACKEYGLKFGVYLSPWDRNYADYGKPEYITYFRNQLRELLTEYGEIFEVWYDGANGGSGYYGGANETRKIDRTTYYEWPETYRLVRELQPNIVIWNDGGDRADLRWVGTESGYVGETNWSLLNAKGDVPYEMLHHGVEDGEVWVPAEVNTSIRPEWFYHPYEDGKVKTLPEMMDIYYHSVGRNATMLLNFPIMPNGLIHETDEKRAFEFANAVAEVFDENLAKKTTITASNTRGNLPQYSPKNTTDADKNSYWSTAEGVDSASITLDFGNKTSFNRFMAQELISLGQRVKSFKLEVLIGEEWREIARETTIGYKRILRFPTVESTKLRLTITKAKGSPVISNIGVFNAPQILTAPKVIRRQSGEIVITPADFESEVYYTLDGSSPTIQSKKYLGPITTNDGKVQVKAFSFNPLTRENGPVTEEVYDVSRKNWKILNETSEDVYKIIDGNSDTYWQHPRTAKIPLDLVIDLGKNLTLSGFRYLPNQNWWGNGIITKYELHTSMDNQNWKLVQEGEFSNIANNPLWQNKSLGKIEARYIKFTALQNTDGDHAVGYAEFEVITD